MSSLRVHSYLRTHRRKWALTQKDLIFLLGRRCASNISKLEQGKRVPGADILIACEVLFGRSANELFPKLYADVEEQLMVKASALFEALEYEDSPIAKRKKALLSVVLERAITRINSSKEHEQQGI